MPVFYILNFITEKQTNSMYHECRIVHFLFSSTQEQQHQNHGNASSCHSNLHIIFSCIKMQFTLY